MVQRAIPVNGYQFENKERGRKVIERALVQTYCQVQEGCWKVLDGFIKRFCDAQLSERGREVVE